MRLTTMMMAIPAMAVFAFAQSDQNSNTQRSQSTQTSQSTESTTTTTQQRAESHNKSDNKDMVSTKTFKGTLVDANCAGGSASMGSGNMSANRTTDTSGNTGSATNTSTNSGNSSTSTADRSASSQSSSANRSQDSTTGATGAANSKGQSCPATASTTAFALVTSDGKMLRFDDVGNTRASEAVKTHTKWTQSGKPAKVKVHGIMMGDTLQVQEIR